MRMQDAMNTPRIRNAGTKKRPDWPRRRLLTYLGNAIGNGAKNKYKTLVGAEDMPLKVLRAHPTKGTVFERLDELLRNVGYEPDGTVGFYLDVARLTQTEVDYFTCCCVHGGEITGSTASCLLRNLAAHTVKKKASGGFEIYPL